MAHFFGGFSSMQQNKLPIVFKFLCIICLIPLGSCDDSPNISFIGDSVHLNKSVERVFYNESVWVYLILYIIVIIS